MILVLLLLLVNNLILLPDTLLAQDERYVRRMIKGMGKESSEQYRAPPFWQVESAYYNFDLNEDGVVEKFQWLIRDGLHSVQILNSKKQLLFEQPLPAVGGGSWPYKIRIASLSAKAKVILIYSYQGFRSYLEPYGSTQVYFITLDNNDLTTLRSQTGPYVWEESEKLFHRYHQRFFDLTFKDIDRDGTKEIVIRSHKIVRVYSYHGMGRWKEI